MASLTILPQEIQSASQSFLHRLPLPNQSISKFDKEPAIVANRNALEYAVLVHHLFKVSQRFSETVISSERTSRELFQARQIWTEKGVSTFYTFEAQLQWLQLIYTLRRPAEVLKFLERNKFLASLLIAARCEISNYFLNSQVFLELDTDPEEIDDQQLIASIATNYAPGEALRRLKQFDENWWLDALDRAQRKLCINVEFE